MIKTYYKFALEKESLISAEQATYLAADPGNFTCVEGLWVPAVGVPDLNSTTVKCQNGMLIPKGIAEGTEIPAQDLDGFVIEKLFSQALHGQYYEKFYIG